MSEELEQEFVKAAGGLVWWDAARGVRLLVVHRARYDDWSLPKGKLEEGETWPEAARREVTEETGFTVICKEFAGVTTYYHGRRPKVVLFWNMIVSDQAGRQPDDGEETPEVDQIKWLDAQEAAQWLTYPAERALVAENWPHRR